MINQKLQDFTEPLIALILLFLLSPLLIILYILHKLYGEGGFIFKQLRAGKDKKPFLIYKIRTMVIGAENLKNKLKEKNEADGPVFKIADDPRYTKIGKIISHSGLDETLQLINIIKGEMSFIGPRPLPLNEAKKIPKKYQARFSVKPGITSLWVLKGAFHNNFDKWMKLDMEYVRKKNLWLDIKIMLLSSVIFLELIIRTLVNVFRSITRQR